MNRPFPYHIFPLALLAGSALLIAVFVARPLPASGEQGRDKGAPGGVPMVALAEGSAAGRQAGMHFHGTKNWSAIKSQQEKTAGKTIVALGSPLPLLVLDPKAFFPAAATSPSHRPWFDLSGVGKSGRGNLPSEGYALRSARKLKTYVDHYAAKFRIKPKLVFAIIKTESNFNARAASHASAFGLMQLVPKTGGRVAYKMVHGKDVVPSRKYLQDPDNNIELGTAYLRHLAQVYFDAVENAESREYCLIAAYNTGPGNVYRAFGGDYNTAIAKINSLSPSQVYAYLKRHLPYKETRKYLFKVVSSQQEFAPL